MIAKTFSGLEEVLAAELNALGAQNIQTQNRAVSFWGAQTLLYRCNLWLRTALRVLKPVYQFNTTNEHQLYRQVQEIDWRRYLSVNDTLAVNAVVHSPHFTHSQYVALKVKDAIVDQFRQHTGRRPSIDPAHPSLRVHVHIANDQCTLALDSSGESLHKRGYRLDKSEAPLNEALAAGLALLTGWNGQGNFVDPMCGSGTIVIEAAMIAHNTAPGLKRKFGFMTWKDFDAAIWERVQREAFAAIGGFEYKIIGADILQSVLRAARKNARQAGVEDKVEFMVSAFEEFVPPAGGGVLLMNPPYGERMKKAAIESFYKMIGDGLKQRFAGYDAWIFSGNPAALKHIGLRPSQKHTLYNGGLECRFQKFAIYEGSIKSKYSRLKES
jgi:putative N6-adenine-specific DNA methylase